MKRANFNTYHYTSTEPGVPQRLLSESDIRKDIETLKLSVREISNKLDNIYKLLRDTGPINSYPRQYPSTC